MSETTGRVERQAEGGHTPDAPASGRTFEARASRGERDDDRIRRLVESRGAYPRVMETEMNLEEWCKMNYPLLKMVFTKRAQHPDGLDAKIYTCRNLEKKREDGLKDSYPSLYTKIYSFMDETLRAQSNTKQSSD